MLDHEESNKKKIIYRSKGTLYMIYVEFSTMFITDVVILINRKLYAWTWCVNVLKIYINTTLTFKVFQNVTNDGIICNSFS